MITWKKQGNAVYGEVTLQDSSSARVVIVDGAKNPKGIVLVTISGKAGATATTPFHDMLEQLGPRQVAEALALQERLFGRGVLPAVILS
jgi:hypothetical protein